MSRVAATYDAQQVQGDGFLLQLWRFARPHTIIGTTLSLVALYAIADGIFPSSTVFGFAGGGQGVVDSGTLLLTWIACIGANVYIVGLNQLTDIPLDRINKPYLPLASGAWTPRTGWVVIGTCFGVSLLACLLVNSTWLWYTVVSSLILGTLYSLPPVRLKRYSFWAAFCIIAVRSLIVNVLLFAHVAGWQASWRDMPPPVWLLVFVMFAFSVAIAWYKDLPDLEGDRTHGVSTLALQLGSRRVLRLGALVLGACLLLAAGAPWLVHLQQVNGIVLSAGQLAVLLTFVWSVSRVQLSQKPSIRQFYLTLWGLFFAEYALFAAAAQAG